METKKISFGFLKTKKAEKPVMILEEKRDYIECVEEKSIKVVGGEATKEVAPLIIPMKPNTLITAERLKVIAEEVEKAVQEPDLEPKLETDKIKDEPTDNETLDQMAVRELLREAKKEVKVECAALTVPLPPKPVTDGEKESTLDDYESVPVQDFGMAMLRGMGWTASKDQSKYKQPQLRPKGLGLGADKVVKENQKIKSTDHKGEELAMVKNAFVKITTGKYAGYYAKVVSLDEDNGRVMVDITVKKETVSLSEFMMQPVTKAEFDRESKVINADSFHEYKRQENVQKCTKYESPKVGKEASSSQNSSESSKERRHQREDNNRRDCDSSNGKSKERSHRSRKDSSSSEDRCRRRRRKDKKRYSSNESLSSHSDTEKRKKEKHKSSRRCSSRGSSKESDSDRDKKIRHRSKTPEGKRDIDKKRKGKKKKRDRDRSPNHKKHRK